MNELGHIVYATEMTEPARASYLHIAQPMTLQAMTRARDMAASRVSVALCAVLHRDENVEVSPSFVEARGLTSYAWQHIEALKNAPEHKPLPRLVDILNVGSEAVDAEYLIFSNVDISPRSNFYISVQKLVSQGYDALCINRQNLPKAYEGILLDQTTLDLALSLVGQPTRGIDCFVFKKDILPRLELGNTFVGFPPVGQVLKTQIERHSDRFMWIKDGFYTFHIGDDQGWTGRSLYREQNELAAKGLWTNCFPKPSLRERIVKGPRRRLVRWALQQYGRA